MNLCNQRKSRVQAPCCGRYRYRYQLEHDGDGNYYCDHCWAATPMYPPAAGPVEAPRVADFAAPGGDAAAGMDPPAKAALVPRVDCGEQPAKRRKNALKGTVEFYNQWKAYGYALFPAYPERVISHAKDCAGMQPTAGDAVSAVVHRRRKDGRLLAFKVEPAEIMEERLSRVHATLLGSS